MPLIVDQVGMSILMSYINFLLGLKLENLNMVQSLTTRNSLEPDLNMGFGF